MKTANGKVTCSFLLKFNNYYSNGIICWFIQFTRLHINHLCLFTWCKLYSCWK
jgi:hypothetical protein